MTLTLDSITKSITVVVAIAGGASVWYTAEANEEELKDLKPKVQTIETENALLKLELRHIKEGVEDNKKALKRIEEALK